MTKKLNITSITNELEGSAFFPSRIHKTTPLPVQSIKKDIKPEPVPPYGSTPRSPSKTEAPRRKIKQRHPFDIYQDQIDSLRELSFKEKMKGELGSMSAMVREALDNYLKNRKV
jgi:hypothetical protein